jgi:hypothetical protein
LVVANDERELFFVIFFSGTGFASPFRPATPVFLGRRTVR